MRSWRKTRIYRSVVSLKRSAQNLIGTLTLGRARLAKPKFPTSGANSPGLSGIAKRRITKAARGNAGGLFTTPLRQSGRSSIALAVEKVATLCALVPYGQKLCSALAVLVLKAPTGRIVLIIRPS